MIQHMEKKELVQLPDFSEGDVLVYGDVMLDRYWEGQVSRISPEAPVPVVNVDQMKSCPGGAANVAKNIAVLGGQVTLCGLVGDDKEAEILRQSLDMAQIDCRFLALPGFKTTAKLRVMGMHQQLIRLDFEESLRCVDDAALFADFEKKLLSAHVVVLSDYAKGALSKVERLIQRANDAGVIVLVDPKCKDFKRYTGATLLTPNRKEFELVVGQCRQLDEIVEKGQNLLQQTGIESLLVTLGKEGMIYIPKGQEAVHFGAKARDVYDVTGAGDTVIAVLAASLAAGMSMIKAIELANIGAGIVVGKMGAETVTPSELQYALTGPDSTLSLLDEPSLLSAVQQAHACGEKVVMTNGCFDILHAGHVDYLTKARALGDRLIIAVNDDDSVRRLKGETRPLNPLAARMKVLGALGVVDWVVPFSEDTPERLISQVLPDILVKGGDYQITEIAGHKAVFANGGDVQTIPLLPGFSTTNLVEKMKESMT